MKVFAGAVMVSPIVSPLNESVDVANTMLPPWFPVIDCNDRLVIPVLVTLPFE